MRPRGCSNCNQPGHTFHECPKTMCNRCGEMGHIGKFCNDRTYLSLKNFQCGCNPTRILTRRDNNKIDTHCCVCNKKELLTRMEKSVQGTKARCRECADKAERNDRGKRMLTPPMSPRETKRITTPTPYDAMMELTLEEERKNGETSKSHKTYAESVREGLERAVEKKELTKEEAFPTVGINGGKSLLTISKLQERAAKDAGIIQEEISHETCKNCKFEDEKSAMYSRLEGYNTVYYCSMACQYAMMVCQEMRRKMDEGELPTRNEIDKALQKLLHKFAYSTRYGKADKESIVEALYKRPIDEQACWQKAAQEHIKKEAEKLAEVMAEDMVIEHENAPDGLEYYKTMDRWNKREIEQMKEENKKLQEEVERLKKELEEVKFVNGTLNEGAKTNQNLLELLRKEIKEIKTKNNKDKSQEVLELQKRNQELNDVIAQQNQSIETQNETIVELNMIRMEPYMEIISTMEPTCGCCLVLERIENEGLIKIQLSSRCQVIYLTNLYAQCIPQETQIELEAILTEEGQNLYNQIFEEPMEITEERITEEKEEDSLTKKEKKEYLELLEFLEDDAKKFFSTNQI